MPLLLLTLIIINHDYRDAADVKDDDEDDNEADGALLADDTNAVSQVFARVASHIMPEVKVVMRKMMIISRLEDKLVGSF